MWVYVLEGNREVNQVEVEVIEPKIRQTAAARLPDVSWMMIGIP